MKTEKDILLKKINKYQKRHIAIYRKHFKFFRKTMAVRYDTQNKNNFIFYDYYSKNDRFTIKKDVLRYTCRDFHDRIETMLKCDNCSAITFTILHFTEASFKFMEFLSDVEVYYELYNDKVDEVKLDRRKEFKDVYDIIDNIK